MNPVIQPPKKKALRYSGEEEAMTQVPLHQVKQQALNEKNAGFLQQRHLTLKKVKNQVLPFLLAAGLVAVAALWFGTNDVINKEGYQALMLILLLLQMKHLSQTIKQQ